MYIILTKMEGIAEAFEKTLVTKEGETLADVLASIRDELKKMNDASKQKKTSNIFDLLSGGLPRMSNNEDEEDDEEEEEEDEDDEENEKEHDEEAGDETKE